MHSRLGTQCYFSLMAAAGAMVGNSSSGLIEAPSFSLPVVNVGNRQCGRVRAENVIDVGCARGDIVTAVRRALSAEFRRSLDGMANPYGSGDAAEKTVEVIREVDLSEKLIVKRFNDLPVTTP